MASSIASAVVLPEPDDDVPARPVASPPASKRRQSSTHEQDAKRPRLTLDATVTGRCDSVGNETTSPAAATAPPPKGRERGRERRLFGAVLGALSQNSASAAHRRRSEIEKRQQAQRKQEDEESEQRKRERWARRKAQRWREQDRFQKESMRIRHDNLLAQAHFLQTTTEPRLFYKPWETSPEEDELIREQIARARDTIRRELSEAALRSKNNARERGVSRRVPADSQGDTSASGTTRDAETASVPIATNDGPSDGRAPLTRFREQGGDHAIDLAKEAVNQEHTMAATQHGFNGVHGNVEEESSKETVDEAGEEVVEAAEDTVIY